jgi:hypothetical protein
MYCSCSWGLRMDVWCVEVKQRHHVASLVLLWLLRPNRNRHIRIECGTSSRMLTIRKALRSKAHEENTGTCNTSK